MHLGFGVVMGWLLSLNLLRKEVILKEVNAYIGLACAVIFMDLIIIRGL